MDLISIIVPIYKVEKYLNRCVESIVQQTYSNLEIILVDDGSPDNCPKICDDWLQKDNRIKVVHKENGGLSDARNAGIALAAGNFIGFIDSDDWIAPEMYERLLNSIHKDETDIAACTVEMTWEDNKEKNKLLTVKENVVLSQIEAQETLLNEDKLNHPVWNKLYKRETIDGLLFEKGKYHEDVFWTYKAIGNADSISIIDYVGYFYFQRNDSIMGHDYSIDWIDYVDAICERHEYFETKYPELETRARLYINQNCIYHTQMTYKHLSGEKKKTMLDYMRKVNKKYKVHLKDYSSVSLSQGVFIAMSRVSLKYTALIKNLFRIGI